MTITIRRGAMPKKNPHSGGRGRLSPTMEAAKALRPGEWFIADIPPRGSRKAMQVRIISASKYGTIHPDTKTYTAADGSLVVYRPKEEA